MRFFVFFKRFIYYLRENDDLLRRKHDNVSFPTLAFGFFAVVLIASLVLWENVCLCNHLKNRYLRVEKNCIMYICVTLFSFSWIYMLYLQQLLFVEAKASKREQRATIYLRT